MTVDLARFYDDVVTRLQQPIQTYCDARRPGMDPGLAEQIQARVKQELQQVLSDTMDAAGVIGGGGALSDEAIAALDDLKARQFEYLNGFMADLTGMDCSAALARAALYATAVIHAISIVAVIGLPTLPYMPGDQNLDCTFHCGCHLEVTKLTGEGDFDVYWVVNETKEHCNSCQQLTALWNPLQIRAGKLTGDYQLKAGMLARARILHALTAHLQQHY